jgi:ketosteroid isomerase-like protein
MDRHDTRVRESRAAEISSCYLHGGGQKMSKSSKTNKTGSFRTSFSWRVLAASFALGLLCAAAPVSAQKKDKKQKNQPADSSTAPVLPTLPQSDSQAVDRAIGEMLGYWQLGDTDSLHKYYADDVAVVSGTWEPPVVGWDNFLKAYQAQRAQTQNARLERSNTLIKVTGNFAWATYQFAYSAVAEGKIVVFHGHTSLVLARQGDRWVITLNHSSITDVQTANQPAAADLAQPAKP